MPVLFGLVVAIGIVVDDAIVVVENVESVMKRTHLPPKEATIQAMKEVLAPVMSITVVLMAVFIPTAFLPGISGQLFKQFALTIAASTFLSGVCAITLTPALCGVILRPHKEGHKPFILVRLFNQGFDALANGYARLVKFLVHPAVVVGLTLAGFARVCCRHRVDLHQGADGVRPARGPRPDHDRGVDARFLIAGTHRRRRQKVEEILEHRRREELQPPLRLLDHQRQGVELRAVVRRARGLVRPSAQGA
jgi:hypothetical protein